MAPTSTTRYTLRATTPDWRAVMRSSSEVTDHGRGGRRPSGTGRRTVSDVANRDFTAEIPDR